MSTEETSLTSIYSPYPPNVHDPQKFSQEESSNQKGPEARANYHVLPWALETLLGTTWCHILTGEHKSISGFVREPGGNWYPAGNDDANTYGYIGFWDEERFYIENWIRVDHMPPSAQLAWFCVEIASLRSEINRSEDSYSAIYAAEQQEKLAMTIRQARKIAKDHHLPMPQNLLPMLTFPKRDFSVKEAVQSTKTHLLIDDLAKQNLDELCKILRDTEEITLEVPCTSLGVAQDTIDVADDFLAAMFIGEGIAEFCQNISVKKHWHNRPPNPLSILFFIQPGNIEGLAEKLLELARGFTDENDIDYEWFIDAKFGFGAEMQETWNARFPELADDYMANSLFSSDIPAEAAHEEYTQHPEHRYGFWRSFKSKNVGCDFYVSETAWILPHDADIELPLVHAGEFNLGVPDLYEATQVTISNFLPIVFNKNSIVRYPVYEIMKAQKCAEEIFTVNNIENDYSEVIEVSNRITQIFLSEEGDLLLMSDPIAQYIFFYDSLPQVSPKVLEIITEEMNILFALTEEPSNIACPWNEIDDEKFEKLCYDIIRFKYHPFDIIKMGNSRSRDGGRDIIFKMSGHLGQPLQSPTTWIAQCKLNRSRKSITAKDVDIADTVLQYGADGYCIMTSGGIDSTLKDKLDGIERNYGKKYETWSELEIERFLARHLALRKRYFPDVG
jgi:hypothetical protein